MKAELHFYLLFSERLTLVAEDLLLNERLTSILLSAEYRNLLTEGVFVPLLRAHYDSFTDVTQYLKKPDLYTPVSEVAWRPALDQLNKAKIYVGRFDEREAYSNFSDIARFYMFDQAFMEKFEAGDLVSTLPTRIDELRQHANRTELRRSLFFHYAKELEKSKKRRLARLVRHISSVLYTAQFCGQFKQLPAFPGWYKKVLTKTTGIAPQPDGNISLVRELKTVSLRNLSAAIKPEAGLATIEDILEIRSSKHFERFLTETKRFNDAGANNEVLKMEFVHSLRDYLEFLDDRFAEVVRGVRKEKKKLERQISFLEMSTPMGVVLGVTSFILTSTLGVPLSAVTSALWWYTSLAFFAYKREAKKEIETIDLETAKFWSLRCSPGGTFAASLTSAAPRIERKATTERLLTGK